MFQQEEPPKHAQSASMGRRIGALHAIHESSMGGTPNLYRAWPVGELLCEARAEEVQQPGRCAQLLPGKGHSQAQSPLHHITYLSASLQKTSLYLGIILSLCQRTSRAVQQLLPSDKAARSQGECLMCHSQPTTAPFNWTITDAPPALAR